MFKIKKRDVWGHDLDHNTRPRARGIGQKNLYRGGSKKIVSRGLTAPYCLEMKNKIY